MTDRIVAGSRRDVDSCGDEIWILHQKGPIAFRNDQISFGEWRIPFHNIRRAVLNRETLPSGAYEYHLAIETQSEGFLFWLGESNEWENEIPFQFEETHNSSPLHRTPDGPPLALKLMLIMVLITIAGNLINWLLNGI